MKRFRIGRTIKKLRLATHGAWKIRSLFITDAFRLKADAFFEARQGRLVFVLGTGRSGTQLVSDLLGATQNAIVYHEPNFFEDVSSMEEFRRNPDRVRDYWRRFRKFEIYRRWSRFPQKKVYGEVNGTIRYHIPGIISEFPDARLLLLARDGRGVVRSVMGWPQFYGPGSRGAYAIKPADDDPYVARWDSMSRFDKVCWAWMEANEYLLAHIPRERCFRLEALVDDYAIAQRLFKEIGLGLNEASWHEIVSQPSNNTSKSYSFPGWDDWDELQKDRFVDICGSTMEKLGYEIK